MFFCVYRAVKLKTKIRQTGLGTGAFPFPATSRIGMRWTKPSIMLSDRADGSDKLLSFIVTYFGEKDKKKIYFIQLENKLNE